MAKNKTKIKSKSKNKGEVVCGPSTQQSVDWRKCIWCGCFEPFQRSTEECCWTEYQQDCVFITTPTAVKHCAGILVPMAGKPAAAVKLAKGKPDQLE